MKNVKTSRTQQWFDEVWNAGSEEAIAKLMVKDVIAHGVSPAGIVMGTAAFIEFYRSFRQQFHQINITVEDVLPLDDMECARTKVTAVHTATGIKVNFTGMCMTRYEDGKIAEGWNNYDFLLMYQQLGQKLV